MYVKWHFKPDEGVKTMDADRALLLAGTEPDYHVKDLFRAIEAGDFPSWTFLSRSSGPKKSARHPLTSLTIHLLGRTTGIPCDVLPGSL